MGLLFALWSFYTTLCLITATVLCIGFIRFRSLMHLPIVQRRYPRIVLFECVIAATMVSLIMPLRIIVVYDVEEFRHYGRILRIIANCLTILLHLIPYCEACRLWLICYDLHYLRCLQNSSWKLQINSTFGERNWWLLHRQTFGNSRYVAPRMFCCALTSGVIAFTLYQMFGFLRLVQAIETVLFGVPVTFILCVYCKCPKLTHDRYLFLLEVKYTVVIYIVTLCLYGFGMLLSLLYFLVGETLVTWAGWVALSWVSLLSTLWIPKQISLREEWTDAPTASSNENNASQRLFEVFSSEHRLESFASHLNCEFASENLLAFIEFMQFKQYFKQIYFGQSEDNLIQLKNYQIRFDFGEQPLQSEIVYQTVRFDYNSSDVTNEPGIMGAFKRIAFLLYDRYIREGAELEINISSAQRMRYNLLMQNKAQWLSGTEISAEELSCLFDIACLQLYQLMNDAFQRFKRGDEKKLEALQSVSSLSYASSSSDKP